jgi:hypothetical protein
LHGCVPLAAWLDRACRYATALVGAGIALVLLVVVGRPLATDDAWWHLAHGAAYTDHGPLLSEDPLLFTAPGPPAPASWLADVALHATLGAAGFAGLRALHVGLALAIVALAWRLLGRAAGSLQVATAACVCFVALSGYRLFQLRPELFTLLATLLLAWGLLEPARPVSRRRVALVAVGSALWSNLHPGFLLAPVLIAVAAASLVLATPLRTQAQRRGDLRRARGLAVALAAALLGSLLNPVGPAAYRPLLAAGTETPGLARVADEWTKLALFAWPAPVAPGGALGWALVWVLLAATAWVAWRCLRAWPRGESGIAREIDPLQVGLAAASLVAMLGAVRFLWLGIFPLLLVTRALRAARWLEAPGPWRRMGVLALTLSLGIALFHAGDGRRWLRTLPRTMPGYAAPFDAARYFAHSAWLMRDAELEGRLFADYFLGGFLGYWLAPRVRCFVNGSLNVKPEAMAANLPLRVGRGERVGESFLELLDRHGIDLYLGTRLPEEGPVGRPWFATTTLLEGAPGWVPIFRNLHSALYLRRNSRNAPNLERVAAYYERRSVPFDPSLGFDVARVIREAPRFALARGIVPLHIKALAAARDGADPASRRAAANRLASTYAVLGLYDEAIRLDRQTHAGRRPNPLLKRRLVWALLRTGRTDEALAAVRDAVPAPGPASLWLPLAEAARAPHGLEPLWTAGPAATPPFLTRSEARQILSGFETPAPRGPRGPRGQGSL